MHGQLLSEVYRQLKEHAHCNARFRYGDLVICFIHMLASISQRSELWAWDKRNWPLWARHLERPSYSQHMRRLRSDSVGQLLSRISASTTEQLRQVLPSSDVKICDGKPLTVSGFSRDPEATLGKVPGGWGYGYKLHAVVDSTGVIEAWRLTSLHVGEATIGRDLLAQLDLRGCVVLGDGNFDSNQVYELVAGGGGRFIAPRRKLGRGFGWRKHHPDRLRAVHQLERAPDARTQLARHKRQRLRVEQVLGHLCNLPGGLSPLPNHVRRLRRVRRWVASKIHLYHLHLLITHRRRMAA